MYPVQLARGFTGSMLQRSHYLPLAAVHPAPNGKPELFFKKEIMLLLKIGRISEYHVFIECSSAVLNIEAFFDYLAFLK